MDYTTAADISQQWQRLTSSSGEEEERVNRNGWQVIRSTKRKKVSKTQHEPAEGTIMTNNRFAALEKESGDNFNSTSGSITKTPSRPPIFVHGAINYRQMVNRIRGIEEHEQYDTKCLANNVIKMDCATPDTYRKMDFCNKPYVCVKCSGSHSTSVCKKNKETPARCVLCGGDHPANYRGCEHYRNLIKGNSRSRENTQRPAAPVSTSDLVLLEWPEFHQTVQHSIRIQKCSPHI
nr:unnamed protein product [Callosobruchus analis]